MEKGVINMILDLEREDPPTYYEELTSTTKEVKRKIQFYFEKGFEITFRIKGYLEYFYSGSITSISYNNFNILLNGSNEATFNFQNIDDATIHPSTYQPIRYFEREKLTEDMRKAILKRDNNECQIRLDGCSKIAEEIDHIIPVSKGGRTIFNNLQASCKNCNRKKGGKIND